MPLLSSVEGRTDCCNFILGNYFFAFDILSTMCRWLMAEVDLKPIPVTREPKAWPCHSQAGWQWHWANVETLCASVSSSVAGGVTHSLRVFIMIKWDHAFERDFSVPNSREYNQCSHRSQYTLWPVSSQCQYQAKLSYLMSICSLKQNCFPPNPIKV
jgi:hypothetical protein